MKRKVGITGSGGFIGSYLFNRISLMKDRFMLVPFERSFFDDASRLHDWVKECDVIIHMAALNRHEDADQIYNTNVSLVDRLVSALAYTGVSPHVIFASSTQEDRQNLYGNSKREGRLKIKDWAERHNAVCTGLVIPNVFGPFGRPFYNSVVATFCHQLCNGQVPVIDNDADLQLVYVDELADEIIRVMNEGINDPEFRVQPGATIKVSGVLAKLNRYRTDYLEKGIFPALPDKFSCNLFNTFRSYIDYGRHFPVRLKQNIDLRGTFVETLWLEQGGQVSFSTTEPGITRGNHFHTRKIERFVVIKGEALIQLRKYNSDEVLEFHLSGDEPAYVDMPVWYIHNIKNTGSDTLYTIFWINEFFDPADPDTFFEPVEIKNDALV